MGDQKREREMDGFMAAKRGQYRKQIVAKLAEGCFVLPGV